ncbi:MAG: transcription termination/antitermination protein NusA [Gemmatimonadota bacterium]|nr:MAG: transcription termination/antitermination protein NusA [Gemmatimonadota bacterium]
MNYEIVDVLNQLTNEKNISRDFLVETLETGIISAAKKRFGETVDIEVHVDLDSGEIRVFRKRRIVEEVEDPCLEISLSEASEIESDAAVGKTVQEMIPFEDFGRNAIQAAKQILMQRVREAERENIYDEYEGRMGDIVTGTVQQVDRGDLIINLGRTEAKLSVKEQIKKERYRQGETIRACIIQVLKTTKGPQVILSRTHPDFLRRLFEMEVPEIYEGIVHIKEVAREPGLRSKIAVFSNDERIDPVGACVGLKGSRVQAIVRELGNERIDIIPWSSNPVTFASRAISPAKVLNVNVDKENHRLLIIVEDDQLSLAIGRSGQNARLAAKLTGWKLDIKSESEYKRILEIERKAKVPIEEIPGVGNKLADAFYTIGVESAHDLVEIGKDELLAVPGVGEKTARSLLKTARKLLKEQQKLAEKTETEEQEEEGKGE